MPTGKNVSAVLIAGDLFDRKNISATARNAVYHAISTRPEMTFYYLKGNHDVRLFLPNGKECPENLKLFGEEGPLMCVQMRDAVL